MTDADRAVARAVQSEIYRAGLLAVLRTEHKALLDGIRDKRELNDEFRAQLKSALDGFAKTFA